MPYGIRAIITTGDVKGIIENQKAICELGSLMTVIITSRARMIGMVIGVCSCWAS